MEERRIRANGIDFWCLEEGDGPLVLLLHGFPDDARTWSLVAPTLVASGYRVVAPNTRGYPPTEIPAEGFYDSGTLATDARELIRALGEGPALVVGHDWGAATTYYLLAAFPDAVRRAVTLAIPHPLAIARWLTVAPYVHRAFHWFYFQVPGLADAALPADDFRFIDYLWRLWSPDLDDPEHVAGIKRMLAEPGAVGATLAYYRAMFDPSKRDPATDAVRDALDKPIAVPTLTIVGEREGTRDLPERHLEHFSGPARVEIIAGAGHFLQRERPDEVAKLVLEWFASP